METNEVARDRLEVAAMARMELIRRSAASDFWSFCLYADFQFFSKRNFLKKIASAYQRLAASFEEGKSYKVAISLPPRAGKSYITTLFICWMIGRHPEESVMRNACSDDLYRKMSYETRDILRSRKFKKIYPSVELRNDKSNVSGWSVRGSKQVSYYGAGIGGTIIGMGASMLTITDDLYRGYEDAISPVYNDRLWRWLHGTHGSRGEKKVCRIDIGTRWSLDDALGRLEGSIGYDEVIRVPALDGNGASFCEDVNTTDFYKDLRRTIDPVMWAAEYMQCPIELSGGLFSRDEMMLYKWSNETFTTDDYRLMVIDPADQGDDFVSILGVVKDGKFFVSDMICNNLGLELNIPATTELALTGRPNLIRFEGNGGWVQTGRDIRENISLRNDEIDFYIYKETSNKETRILTQAFYIKNNVFFRDDYKEMSEYSHAIDRMMAYVRGKQNQKDDVPDALASACKYLRGIGLMY